MSTQKFRIVLLQILLAGLVAGLFSCAGDQTNQQAQSDLTGDDAAALEIYQQMIQSSANLPGFEVVGNLASDLPEKTEVDRRIVLLDEPTEANVRALLEHHFNQLMVQGGFEFRATPSDIYIYIFASPEQADTEYEGWIGRAVKTSDDTEPRFEVRVD